MAKERPVLENNAFRISVGVFWVLVSFVKFAECNLFAKSRRRSTIIRSLLHFCKLLNGYMIHKLTLERSRVV